MARWKVIMVVAALVSCAEVKAPPLEVQSQAPETVQETKQRVIKEIAEKIRDIFPRDHPESDIRVEGEDVYAVLNTVLWKSPYEKIPRRGYGIVMPKPDSIYVNISIVGPTHHKPLYFNRPETRRGRTGIIYMVSYSLRGMERGYIAMALSYSREADLATVERIKHSIDYYADKQGDKPR